ncbi:MAG TPA: lipid-binding SYLF domain-containing protein [Acetobacteraceae bacterium]|jgi:lipid-binding SYLF domain-containing protein|nr:lipid-binding SYLF domain-containing protein [Acetobacteraceae bacterium]
MLRSLVAVLMVLVPLAARAQGAQQTLVDRATLAVQEIVNNNPAGGDARSLLRRARGAMICPRVFKAGFFFGGQGGGCVLVGRGAVGWSPPAFYDMGSGSFGLQAGIQDSQILLIVLTERGLRALLDSQFKIGGDASLAFATVGIGVQGATTAAFDADIVAYQNNRGLFAGISLEGSLLSSDSASNAAYYGQPLASQQIVLQGTGSNAGADPLREVLTRYSGPAAPAPAARPYASLPPPQPAAGPLPITPPPATGTVQTTPLAPLH